MKRASNSDALYSIFLLPVLLAFQPGLPSAETPPEPSQHAAANAPDIRLPLKSGSVRWAVIGDNGTGERPQFEVASQMLRYWSVVRFDFVTMNGDNIYGGHAPGDFSQKFEEPYKPLLDEKVKFTPPSAITMTRYLKSTTSPTTWTGIATTHSGRRMLSFSCSIAVT